MTEHPPAQILADFGHGRLPHELHCQVEEHLTSCDSCRTYLAELPGDEFAQLFRLKAPLVTTPSHPVETGYEILGELGRGGMGVVYRARDRKLNRLVALKKIKNGSLANREEQQRFLREAEIVARLVHPGIAQIYEVSEEISDDGLPIPCFAMELVEGESLAQRLERGPLPEKEAAALIESLARTIHAAHEQGILHRDLKPGNILLTRSPESASEQPVHSTQDSAHRTYLAKIADFGLAKLLEAQTQSAMSIGGTIIGTPGYMAPEQIRGDASTLGPGTDVYALGAILYECLTGQTPYPKESTLTALEAVFHHDPASVRQHRPVISKELDAICLKCLQQEPGKRYHTALALADDLARLQRHEPILARPATTKERITKWMRRHPWPTALIGLVMLMITGVIVGLTMFAINQQQAITRIEKEKARADMNYRLARQTIGRMLARIHEMKPKKQEGVREFHTKQLEDVLAFHESALKDVDADRPQVQIDTAQTLIEIATLQSTLGRHSDAETSLRRAIALLDRRTDRSEEVIAAQLLAWNKLGSVLLSLGKPNEATDSYLHSQELSRRLAQEHPANLNYQHDLAWSHHNLGAAYAALKRHPEAEKEFLQAVELRQSLLKTDGSNQNLKGYLAESQVNLALSLHHRGNRQEAEKQYAQAETTLRALVRDVPENLESGASLAALLLNKGNVLGELGRVDEALKAYRDGQVLVQGVLQQEPLLAFARQLRLPLYGARANLLDQIGRSPEAIADWDEVVALAAPQNRLYRCMRACSLAAARKTEPLLAELESLMKDQAITQDELQLLQRAVETAEKKLTGNDSKTREVLKKLGDRIRMPRSRP